MVSAFVIRNLSAFYGSRGVLQDLSVDIPSQRITALVGPSGCGKSTFLKLLNRIAETEAALRITGQVSFLGQDIYDRAVNVTKLRQTVGMVFQQPTPFAMSIYDNLAVPARLVGASDLPRLVETCLRKAALWDEVKTRLRSPALALSGGQQQRLCIARALTVQPKVLLLDEPCSALDPVATARIEAVLHTLKQELTLVIVTHNPSQAQRLGDYLLTFGLDQQQCGYLASAALSQPVTG